MTEIRPFLHSAEVPGEEELSLIDAYWRAANYLSVGQIYLLDNPLLREPLEAEHVKPRLLGHFGTTPGLNFLYAHLNRAIRARDLNVVYVAGPGHGGPGLVANAYLEGTYTEVYPHVSRDEAGLARALPAVLVSGRHPESRGTRDTGLDSRGRRTRLRAHPCVRRCIRQSRPSRGVRRRRRRSRDRPAGHELACQQVREPGDRRGRAADSASERIQDREPDRTGADPRGRARRPHARLRLRAALHVSRCRRRTLRGAPSLRLRPRRGPRPDRGDPARRASRRSGDTADLADDRVALTEGMDRAARGRRAAEWKAPGARTRSR